MNRFKKRQLGISILTLLLLIFLIPCVALVFPNDNPSDLSSGAEQTEEYIELDPENIYF